MPRSGISDGWANLVCNLQRSDWLYPAQHIAKLHLASIFLKQFGPHLHAIIRCYSPGRPICLVQVMEFLEPKLLRCPILRNYGFLGLTIIWKSWSCFVLYFVRWLIFGGVGENNFSLRHSLILPGCSCAYSSPVLVQLRYFWSQFSFF